MKQPNFTRFVWVVIGLFVSTNVLFAQITSDVIANYTEVFQGTLMIKNGQYFIVPAENKSNKNSRLKIVEVQFNQQDLVVDFFIEPLSRLERKMEYQMNMNVSFNGMPLVKAYSERMIGSQVINQKNMASYYSIAWEDCTQADEFKLGRFQLVLSANLYGLAPFDCSDDIPSFTQKQKKLYWMMGMGGLGIIGTGVIFDLNGQAQHDRYERQVFANENPSEFQSTYSEANLANETATLLYVAGGTLILLDGILYYIRSKRTQNRAKAFKDYCKNYSLNVSPYFDQSIGGNTSNGIMAQFSLKF